MVFEYASAGTAAGLYESMLQRQIRDKVDRQKRGIDRERKAKGVTDTKCTQRTV